ncbi:hypothetical protein XBO1_850046 [Xenorhabdus bovienii str. oregonense]|uniref:Uncharacterized protein n=1 Tax=Xenorhabdus bovienii str. oregonense TaxID=1398202 RepID=A0A077PAH1_XENBV|nr:hypothetical protein XBO1_850046 [Xenorhabdus bovienii str. oregonense]
MANGARTHDNWNHNPGLYQLSYSHHNNYLFESYLFINCLQRRSPR